MDPKPDQFERILERLAALEARLARLELTQAPTRPPEFIAPPTTPPIASAPSAPGDTAIIEAFPEPFGFNVRVEHHEHPAPPPAPRSQEIGRVPSIAEKYRPFLEQQQAAAQAPPTVAPAAPAPAFRAPARPAPTEPRSVERLIGGRYFLAAGSLVVVIGVGLFLKLGYDAGWFRMSNAWKCMWGALFGLVMIVGGEIARRRISVLASTGLSAAGLGALYLSCYAAHGFYALIGPVPAFLLLVLVVALGIAIAVIADLVSVAILAMLGGYLAPFLFQMENPSPVVTPLHTLALLATGLVLAGWRPATFRLLRPLAWWGTVLLGFVWLADQGIHWPAVALPFLALVWAGVHAELIISVRGEHEPADEPRHNLLVRWAAIRPLVTSFASSAWCVASGVWVLRTTAVLPDWFVPAAAMGGASILAMVLAGHLRVLRDSPRTDAQRLGAGLAMQAGALLIAAVALALTGSLEVLAWLALGVAAVATGAWLLAPSLSIYGLCVLCIAVARLVTYDAFITRRVFQSMSLGPITVDRWTLLMALAGAAWIATAQLFLRTRQRLETAEEPPARVWLRFLTPAPDVCAMLGVLLVMFSLLHPLTHAAGLAVAWLAIGSLTSVARLLERRLRLETIGLISIGMALLAWFRAYVSDGWIQTATGDALHPGFLIAAVFVVVLTILGVWYRHGTLITRDVRAHITFCVAAAIALAWTAISLEAFRIAGPGHRATTLSLTWLVLSLTTIALWRTEPRLRLDSLGLAGIAAALVSWGVAYIEPGWSRTGAGYAVHPGLLIAGAFVVALSLLSRWYKRRTRADAWDPHGHMVLCAVAAATLAWGATSLEVFRLAAHFESGPRAQHAAVSVWWGLFAVGLVTAGFRWRVGLARHAGLTLLAAATLKALVVDLAEVSPGWRVVSVLGLGLLMLGVALVYVKTSAKLLAFSTPGRRG